MTCAIRASGYIDNIILTIAGNTSITKETHLKMLSKHFSIISCLLLNFVGTASACYNEGMEFDNTVTKGDMANAIVGFCNKHGGTQFTLNDKVWAIIYTMMLRVVKQIADK